MSGVLDPNPHQNWSVILVTGQFAFKYKSETYYWTQKLNKEDYGVDKYHVLLAVVKE